METRQVSLALTDEKDVLRQLERNVQWTETPKGRAWVTQWDGKVLTFYPGVPITLNESIAKDLLRRETIVVGDDLKGPIKQVLRQVGSYDVVDSLKDVKTKTTCQFCGKECGTPGRLGQHILRLCPVLEEEKATKKEAEESDESETSNVVS